MSFNHTPRRRFTDKQRLAFFEKHGGICHLCGLKIQPLEPWEVEHVIARELLGPMADEDDNLRPAHVACHRAKTKQDKAAIAKSNRVRAKWHGAHRPKSKFPAAPGFHRPQPNTRQLYGDIEDAK